MAINNRQKTDMEIERLLEFQRTIAGISSRFVGLTNIDDAIKDSLRDIGILSGAGSVFLVRFEPDSGIPARIFEYSRDKPAREEMPEIAPVLFTRWNSKISNEKFVRIDDVSLLPPEAADERKCMEAIGAIAALGVPIVIDKHTEGFIGLFNLSNPIHWPDDCVDLVKLSAKIIAKVLQRAEAEEKVRAKEKYFRTIIENTVETIVIVDETGKIKYRSPSIFSMSGYKPGEIIGENFTNFLHPDEIPIAINMFYDGIKAPEKTVSAEFRIKNKDGTWTYVAVIGKNALNDPVVKGVILNLRDITESKKSEERIAQAVQHWRATFDAIRDMVWICDESCSLMRVNKAFAEVTGYEPRQIIAKKCYEVLKEANIICPHCPHKKVISDGKPVTEIVPVSDKYFEITASPVLYDKTKVSASICIARDITRSRQMEEALINAAQQWHTTFFGIGEGICLTDENGHIMQCNQAFTELLGKPFDEIVGHDYQELLIRPVGMTPEVSIIDMIQETMIRQKLTLQLDERWFNLIADPVFNEKNNFIGATLVFSDITESKSANEKMQQLYQVETDLRQKLEEEIKRRVEFTRLLVHELKTPLTPILASSEILVEELREEPWQSLAKNVHLGGENLNRRIDELFDLARGEVGLLNLNLQETDMNILLQDIVKYMVPVATNNKLEFTTHLSPLPPIIADEDRLRQVLLNLIGNAVKYTPAGGKISLSAYPENNNLIIEVTDTGSGIEEEEQKQLFQPYHRAAGDRKNFSGLGLGLALSKILVESHGGKIWVKSQRGDGSTFAFSIPIRNHPELSEK